MKKKWLFNKNVKFDSDKLNRELRVSPWAGHRNFAYDLISYIEPTLIVELGTHYGCSFFAFLQSVKDFNLSTRVYAIDTWAGEEHAGFYGNEVYQMVKNTIDKYFDNQNAYLLRTYFDQAIDNFEDNSIDILHIDGLHTFEATHDDFYNYLPKLKENGIVLFHDIAQYTGYGSHIFWEELKSKYSSYIEFEHSWGLGILFPKGDEIYKKLKLDAVWDFFEIYLYKGEYEILKIQNIDKDFMIAERDKTIKAQTKLIDERDKALHKQAQMIDERDKALKAQTRLIDERDQYIKELERKLNGA